jgi:hypothetical protein
MPALNNTQLEILKLFQLERSEEELLEIKKLLSEFLFKKAIAMADKEHSEKNYTDQDVENWTKEHFRTANSN